MGKAVLMKEALDHYSIGTFGRMRRSSTPFAAHHSGMRDLISKFHIPFI
jgi:hypothetical protein